MISFPQTFDMEIFTWDIHPELEKLRRFSREGALTDESIITPLDARFHLYDPYKKDKQFKIRHVGLEVQVNALGGSIKIEQELYIGDRVVIYGAGSEITIGENVKLSPYSAIYASHHSTKDHNLYDSKPVVIGNDVWVCDNAKIMPGVKIADGCTIGANSVVTQSVRFPKTVVGGVPAQIIRRHEIE